MPDGTVEDSRTNSPQWGYLRVENTNECRETATKPESKENMQESADRLDPKGDNGLQSLVNNLGNPNLEPWNKILVFVNETDNSKTGNLKRGDRVCFELIPQTVNDVVYWMANVTLKR